MRGGDGEVAATNVVGVLERDRAGLVVRRRGEAIPHAAHGLDAARARAELLSQPLHVRVDRARRDVAVDLPDVAEERRARLHAVAAVAERHEQLELERRQVHRLLVHPRAVGVAVDLQAPEPERRRRRALRRLPPEDRLDAEQELANAERLDDVVVGAELEAHDPVDLLPLRRHHDDGDVQRGLIALERLADLEAGDVREHQVEEEHVRERGARELQPFEPGLGDGHVVAGLGEVVAKHLAEVELVIDHEDTRHGD